MITYPDQPDTDPTKDDNDINDTLYVLRSDYTYKTVAGYSIVVPAGFKTDEVSIPRLMWTLIGMVPDGYYRAVGVVHDYLYSTKGLNGVFTRKQCDDILLEILTLEGTPRWQRYACWVGVRIGGVPHWGGVAT
jgi:hypothetical protein